MTIPGATAELPASLQNVYSNNDANFPEAGGVLKLHFCWFNGLREATHAVTKEFPKSAQVPVSKSSRKQLGLTRFIPEVQRVLAASGTLL